MTDLEQVYDLLPESHTFQSPLSHEDGVRINMLLSCRRNLTVGILPLIRGYDSNSSRHLREAIECLAFAICISKKPALAQIWAEATKGNAEWNTYRTAFKRAVGDAKTELKGLFEKHDDCSKASHPSIRTLARYLRTGNSLTELPIQWADVMNEKLLLHAFFNDLYYYFRIVEGFAHLFRLAAKPESELDNKIAAFWAKLVIHEDRNRRQIEEMKESDHWIR